MSSESTTNVDERIQETAFNDAAIVYNDESSTPDSEFNRVQEMTSIINFLKRPALLWQSRITADSASLNPINTMTGNTITQVPLKTFYFPTDLMKVGNKMDKIRNFEWFKTDVKLRILINANPFIAGRLWITYSPQTISQVSQTPTIKRHARIVNKGRVGITSYPGVELDLQTTTAAEIVIPWIDEGDAAVADVKEQTRFRCDIWLLTPLLVADNSLSIPIQVYGSFDNIQLKFPTPIARAATRQAKGEAKGPITEVSAGVSSLAKRMQNLPVVGTIASKAGWAADLIGGAASFLGWSKPIEGSHAEAFVHIPGRGMSNFKAKDSATVLGMANDNEIAEKHQNFVSDVDEMQVSHICSRPGLIDVIDWPTTAAYNELLGKYSAWRNPEDPNTYRYTEGSSSKNCVDPTLAEYTMLAFHMYRADWTFRLSLVKTAFHVGRFEVFFIPNSNSSQFLPNEISALDTTNCYRQVFDITEQNEMSFEIPYMHRNILLRETDPEDCVGTLVVRVVSPLTCPDTVSQSIKILVWKFATDVALANPHPRWHTPLSVGNPTEPKPATRQINVTNEPKGTYYVVFDKGNDFMSTLDAVTLVAGETCVNMREATRAFRRTSPLLKGVGQDVPLVSNLLDYKSGGYLGWCSNVFYFYRGGLSYKFLTNSGKGLYSWLSTQYSGLYVEPAFSAPFHITPGNNPIHEVSVPFYSQTRRQVCSKEDDTVTGLSIDYSMPTAAVMFTDLTYPDVNDTFVYQAGKDDLTFGFLIGAPIVYQEKS